MPSVIWKGKSTLFTAGVNTTLVEQPNSPAYVFGEKITCVRRFKGLHSLCLSSAPYRGAVGTGSMAGFWVTKSTINREAKQVGELVVEYEANGSASGASLPPDEFGVHPFEMNPKVEAHPLFLSLTDAQREFVRNWIDAPTVTLRNTAKTSVGVGTLAEKLGKKLLKGIETYYLAGWAYSWAVYSWSLPTCSKGASIETPGGPMAGHLGSGVDWLREADDLDYNGSHYKLTITWKGGPSGHWDSELYP